MQEVEMKVFITPQFTHEERADGGIRRVVDAQIKYLPHYGWDVVSGSEEADVIACHGSTFHIRPDRPMVAHCHGLYWDSYRWDGWGHDVNRMVARVLSAAIAHTAPSKWVNTAMRRGMMIYPRTIYHGVDLNDWKVEKDHGDYILWNKARADPVSNPAYLDRLAELMPERRFISTIGTQRRNVVLTGPIPYEEMKKKIQGATVYLATTRETFGIGTLEALACGVPVAGWDYGGQSEIIVHGETGYLAPFNDYKALVECVNLCYQQRKRLSENARADVAKRWGWENRIKEYAEIYSEVAQWWHRPRCKVSVIVTCHDLAKYLNDALKSVLNQTMKNWECIVVDDFSTDNTADVVKQYLNDQRFAYYKTEENLKLVKARNFGFSKANGRYIIYLDADDMLTPPALEILSSQLDINPEIHIAAGHLDIIDANTGKIERGQWPYKEYDWWGQMSHLNQIPYASMMRREVMERSGGYRARCWRAEDAENWCRLTSFGFRAQKVTQATIITWRNTPGSKSKTEPGDGNWTAWFPWSLAESVDEARLRWKTIASHEHPKPELVPWGAQGSPPNEMRFWSVPHHANPRISVIIPCGPGHEKYIIDAIDSVMGQTIRDWEIIVVNDTGKQWPAGFNSPVQGAPWVKVADTNGPLGAGAARNYGVRCSIGEYIAFLDADDIALPRWLENSLRACEDNNALVYTDWIKSAGGKEESVYYETDEFECGSVLQKMRHAMTIVMPRKWHDEIKGFDEKMKGWEDWDYLIALQDKGHCSIRIPLPGFVYMFRSGYRRETSFDNRRELLEYIRKKWNSYYSGRKQLMCGCRKPVLRLAPLPKSNTPNRPVEQKTGAVLIQFILPVDGRNTIVGPATRTLYNFETGDKKYVHAADAEVFLNRSTKGKPHFIKVGEPPPPEPKIQETKETKKPEFPEMPLSEPVPPTTVPDLATMTAIEIADFSKGKSVSVLREMLRQEKEGRKQRKGVILQLTKAMTNAID
jgi:glycosyltransferase involved in cell wall biosynthesis